MSQVALNSRLRLEMAAEGSHIYPCAEPRQLCAGGEETPQTGEGGEGTTWPRQESVPGVPSIACECMGSAMGRNSERIARASKVAGVGAPQCDTACAESGPQGCGAIGDRPTSDIDVSLLPARACPCLLSPRALTSESCNQRWANARPTRTARHARRYVARPSLWP
jgi:hypothetical protein